MKMFALCLLLAVIVVCGCVLTLKTGKDDYFNYALLAAAFLGFWGVLTSSAS